MEYLKRQARAHSLSFCPGNSSGFCRAVFLVFIFLAIWQVIPSWHAHTFLQKAVNALRWQDIQAGKAKLQPYSLDWDESGNITAWVLSLQQSQDRRAHVSKQLTAAGIPFEIIDAVDGQDELDELEVAWAESSCRIRKFAARNKHMRAKVGCDLSHIRLMHRMLGLDNELALVFEDDARISSDFRLQLHDALNALPDDWDLLQLNSCKPKISQHPVRANIYATYESSCTLAYVCRRSFALKALSIIAAAKLRNDIDDFFGDLSSTGKIEAYMTVPFLVQRSELAANSTIQIYG